MHVKGICLFANGVNVETSLRSFQSTYGVFRKRSTTISKTGLEPSSFQERPLFLYSLTFHRQYGVSKCPNRSRCRTTFDWIIYSSETLFVCWHSQVQKYRLHDNNGLCLSYHRLLPLVPFFQEFPHPFFDITYQSYSLSGNTSWHFVVYTGRN